MTVNRIIPWVVATALFMDTLDATILNTALPQMAMSFNINVISLKIALTSYLLSLAVFTPISGWLADRFGTRTIFAFAVIFFTLSSVLCGCATNLPFLVIARILQGIGGALMMPVGRLIILRTFPKTEMVRVMSFVAMPALTGPLLGPVVGGVITTFFSWRWIFFVNVPMGIAGTFLILRYIQNCRAEVSPPFDIPGFCLVGLGFSTLLIGFESVGEHLLSTPMILFCLLLAVASLMIYVVYQKNVEHPVFNLGLFQIKTFRIITVSSLCCRLGLSGIPFLLPILFQVGFGWSPLRSGLMLFPLFVGMIAIKPLIRPIFLTYFNFRKILHRNSFVIALLAASFSMITSTSSFLLVILGVFLYGVAISLQFTVMNALSYADIPAPQLSQATSIASVMLQLSGCFSIVVTGLCVNLLVGFQSELAVGQVGPLQHTFLILGAITALSSWLFLKLSPEAGQNLRISPQH